MDKIFNRAVVNKVQATAEQLEQIKSMADFEPEWSIPGPFDSVIITGGCKEAGGVKHWTLGVYRIIYKPTGETMSIGQGMVTSRRTRHKRIFRNKGKAIISPGGAIEGSQPAQKMFAHDPNIDNWLFQYCFIPSKQLCSEYEKLLQENEEPEFNDLCQGGCN